MLRGTDLIRLLHRSAEGVVLKTRRQIIANFRRQRAETFRLPRILDWWYLTYLPGPIVSYLFYVGPCFVLATSNSWLEIVLNIAAH